MKAYLEPVAKSNSDKWTCMVIEISGRGEVEEVDGDEITPENSHHRAEEGEQGDHKNSCDEAGSDE